MPSSGGCEQVEEGCDLQVAGQVIVGGCSGLATAVRLAASGDTVQIAGRSADRLAAATVAHPDLTGHQLDAADPAAASELAASIAPIGRLIVTLSGNQGAGPLAELDLEVLRTAFEEKLWPTLTVLKAALPHLEPAGSITLIGAITARTAMPGTAGIGALNAAIEALVQPLAAELAPIRVNAASPGYVNTPWWNMIPDADRPAMFDQIGSTLPVGRVASAEDIAEAVTLLATNPNITGTVLQTDGGAHLAA